MQEGLKFLCSKAQVQHPMAIRPCILMSRESGPLSPPAKHPKWQVITEVESTLPTWLKRRHPEWFPAYVHVLKIPETSDIDARLRLDWTDKLDELALLAKRQEELQRAQFQDLEAR